jgi:hypothetical protein
MNLISAGTQTVRRRSTRARSVRIALAVAIGMTLGAGGLALADTALSSDPTPSGMVLTCAGKAGALRYVAHGGCTRGERKVTLADSAPLIASLPSLQGSSIVESPGVQLGGTSVLGDFKVKIAPRVVRDIRKCAYIATPSVVPQDGDITHSAEAVAAPLDAHTLLVHVFDNSGNLNTDGVSIEIYCP